MNTTNNTNHVTKENFDTIKFDVLGITDERFEFMKVLRKMDHFTFENEKVEAEMTAFLLDKRDEAFATSI